MIDIERRVVTADEGVASATLQAALIKAITGYRASIGIPTLAEVLLCAALEATEDDLEGAITLATLNLVQRAKAHLDMEQSLIGKKES